MPGKKNGKKSKKRSSNGGQKLGNMTEEERLIYLEQQRLAEEEFRKQREEFLSAYLQGKITQEQKFSKLNLYKLNHQWRNIMREAKSKELRKDIEILSQTFERVVDRKESVLKSLARDTDEADEQFELAVRAHLQNVDRLIDMQTRRAKQLTAEYHDELEIIKEEFNQEEVCLKQQHSQQMRELQDILFGLEESFLEKEVDSRTDFYSLTDEIKNKNNEEKHALRVLLEAKVDNYWLEFNEAKKAYNEATREKKLNFENLKAKDEASTREIDAQMRRLQKISSEISGIKQRMGANSKNFDEKNRILKEERERMLLHFQQLKAQMASISSQQRQRLTKLTVMSNDALKHLQRLGDRAEKIIKLAEMCRKQETEEEKVVPFPAASLTASEAEDVAAALEADPNEPLAAAMQKFQNLEEFWRRYNKVLLEKLALDKEKSLMQAENLNLRNLLKQYLDGVSVNEEILSTVNPLLIVNGRSNVNMQAPAHDNRVRHVPTVTIEAGMEVRSKRL